jgi:DNA-binding IclR family transcriptional regulator
MTTRNNAQSKTPTTEAAVPARPGKIATLIDLLTRPEGASIEDLARATGWQHHSVRGAIAGTLKRKGYLVTSDKIDGLRRYRIEGRQ